MANNLKNTMEFCGKSYKKEVTKILILDVLLLGAAGVVYYFYKSLTYALIYSPPWNTRGSR